MHGGRDSVCMVQGTSNCWAGGKQTRSRNPDPWPGKQAFISVPVYPLWKLYTSTCPQLHSAVRYRCRDKSIGRGRARIVYNLGAFRSPPAMSWHQHERCSPLRCILLSRYSYSVMVALLHGDGGTPYTCERQSRAGIYTTARAR